MLAYFISIYFNNFLFEPSHLISLFLSIYLSIFYHSWYVSWYRCLAAFLLVAMLTVSLTVSCASLIVDAAILDLKINFNEGGTIFSFYLSPAGGLNPAGLIISPMVH